MINEKLPKNSEVEKLSFETVAPTLSSAILGLLLLVTEWLDSRA